jgi:hypothetical protein
MQKVAAAVLVLSLSDSAAFAQSMAGDPPNAHPLLTSLRVEAARLALAQSAQAQQGAYRPGGMSPAYFWTSIGLLSAGGTYLVTGALVQNDSVCSELDIDCDDLSVGLVVLGAALVASGGIVWYAGKRKARAVTNPELQLTPHGVTVRNRIRF